MPIYASFKVNDQSKVDELTKLITGMMGSPVRIGFIINITNSEKCMKVLEITTVSFDVGTDTMAMFLTLASHIFRRVDFLDSDSYELSKILNYDGSDEEFTELLKAAR